MARRLHTSENREGSIPTRYQVLAAALGRSVSPNDGH